MTLTSAQVKDRAIGLGFDLCGIAPAGSLPGLARLPEWLALGHGGRMTYLNRTARVRADVRRWLPSARAVVVVASHYDTDEPHDVEITDPGRARIARYAWGEDYHASMGRRLANLARWMVESAGAGVDVRWSVDDGPVQEKIYARDAGIGWIGKHTCVISPALGSWILLGVLATSLDLVPDEPALDRCGTCTLCIEACPTGAIVGPYLLDARRCLSYLTIEIRGAIPADQRTGLGSHIFGCDICQDVCPFNAAPPVADTCWRPVAALKGTTLERLWRMDDAALSLAIEATALRRAGVRGLRRNLAVAIGNAGSRLRALLVGDSGLARRPGVAAAAADAPDTPEAEQQRPSLADPMVAEHVAWALAHLQ